MKQPSTDRLSQGSMQVCRGFLFRELYFPNFLFLNFVWTKCGRTFFGSAHEEAASAQHEASPTLRGKTSDGSGETVTNKLVGCRAFIIKLGASASVGAL